MTSSSVSLLLGPLLLLGAFFFGRWYERRKRNSVAVEAVQETQESIRKTVEENALLLAQEARKRAERPGNRADADRMLKRAQAMLRRIR